MPNRIQAAPLLIWTRSKKDWIKDRTGFSQPNQNRIISLPCIKIKPMAPDVMNFETWVSDLPFILLVSSAKSLEQISKNTELMNFLQNKRDHWKGYSFSKKAIMSAKALNLIINDIPGCKNLEQMCENFAGVPSKIVFAGAKHPIIDVASALKKDKNFFHLKLYQTICDAEYEDKPIKNLRNIDPIDEALDNKKIIYVSISSPSIFRSFHKLVDQSNLILSDFSYLQFGENSIPRHAAIKPSYKHKNHDWLSFVEEANKILS